MLRRLPFDFDAIRIRDELGRQNFVPHFMQEFAAEGNDALLLVTTGGGNNHSFDTPMMPTPALMEMPYTRSIWTTLDIPYLRSRFMRIQPGGRSPSHIDHAPWWADKYRVHIPVQTNPAAIFTVGDQTEHLAAGSCWLVDTANYYHSAENLGDEPRIHLVIDVRREHYGD